MLTNDIVELYKNETVAVNAFKSFRVRSGIICKKCGCREHYWLNSKEQFQCRVCKFRTTLRSGSILEGSKLPYGYFFIAVHLILRNGNAVSVDEFQQLTGHKYYDPLYGFIKRIKRNLVQDSSDNTINNLLEVVNKHFHQEQLV